jgi:hypothetical protein
MSYAVSRKVGEFHLAVIHCHYGASSPTPEVVFGHKKTSPQVGTGSK